MNLDILKPLSSRKFLLAVLCAVLGSTFADVHGEMKMEFLKWLLGLYLTANVVQKATIKTPDAV